MNKTQMLLIALVSISTAFSTAKGEPPVKIQYGQPEAIVDSGVKRAEAPLKGAEVMSNSLKEKVQKLIKEMEAANGYANSTSKPSGSHTNSLGLLVIKFESYSGIGGANYEVTLSPEKKILRIEMVEEIDR